MYESVGKSVISVCKMRAYKGLQKDFVTGRKSINFSGFVVYPCLKDSDSTAVEGMKS